MTIFVYQSLAGHAERGGVTDRQESRALTTYYDLAFTSRSSKDSIESKMLDSP